MTFGSCGRKTYVVELAEGNDRTDYVAVSTTAIGFVLLFTDMLGALDAVISVPLVVLILSLLGIAGAVMGYRLREGRMLAGYKLNVYQPGGNMSAHSESHDDGKQIEQTCDDFLNQPIDAGDVEEELRELLRTATREVLFKVPIRRQDGSLSVFQGSWVQHNASRGPIKGGLRFHPDVELDHFRDLARAMTLKCAVVDVPGLATVYPNFMFVVPARELSGAVHLSSGRDSMRSTTTSTTRTRYRPVCLS